MRPRAHKPRSGAMSGASSPPAMTRAERLVLAVAVLASFVAFLDGTLVTIALPAMERDLGGGLATQQWAVDAYLITLGALILLAGSLSDVYGRLLVMRVGLIGFGLTSVAIAAAPNPEVMIIARGLQGVAGALLVPSSLALIMSTFRDRAASARAIGIWTAMTTIALIAGPLIGGLFVDFASWRYAFLVNALPIAITLVLLARLGHRDARRAGASIDWLGAVLCTIGLGGAVYALIEQPRLGWGSPLILVTLVGGILAFAGFLVRQHLARDPMMPLSLFRARNFWAGNVATALVYAALALNGFALSVYLQQGAGLPATLAGLATMPTTIFMIALSARVGTLAGRWGPRPFMTIGPILMGVGALLLLTVTDDFSYWTQVLPSVLVFSLGLTITVAPLTSAILGAIEPERSGIASAINNAIARVAGLVVIAVLAAILGGELDLRGFHRAAIVTAVLMIAGGIVSLVWIQNPRGERADAANSSPAAASAPPASS